MSGAPLLDIDLEAEYVQLPCLARRPMRQIAGDWAEQARAFREGLGERAQQGLAYGAAPRQRLDLFSPPGGPGTGPVALFIHGGYWVWFDRSFFSHLARGPVEQGLTVAVVGYTPCPEATIGAIIEELRQAVAFLARRLGRPVTVYGHSAGGHLSACLLATDWTRVEPALEPGTVPAALAISGLFDLEPLVATSLNGKLNLEAPLARQLSPLHWPPPPGRSMIAAVGAEETAEFRRQTRALVERWGAGGTRIRGLELAGADHFTAIAPLADPASALTADLTSLACAPDRR